MSAGDFHPVILHFPIVLFTVAVVCDLLYLLFRQNTASVAHWMVIMGALMCYPTVFTGLEASENFEPNDSYLIWHRRIGYLTTALGTLNAFTRAGMLMGKFAPRASIPLILSVLAFGSVSVGADYGGILTRGKTPFNQREWETAAAAEATKNKDNSTVVGVAEAHEVFNKYGCSNCHSDVFVDGFPKGISMGEHPMLPRNPDGSLSNVKESKFYQIVIRKNAMPLARKGQKAGLSDEDHHILAAWLESGAPME